MTFRPVPASLGRLLRWLLLAWLLAWLLACAGAGRADVQHEVTLQPQGEGVALAGDLGVFVDDTAGLRIADVLSPAGQARFQYPAEPVHTAMDSRPYWFKMQFRQTGREGDWLVSVPSVAARELQFFGPFDAQGQALARPVVTGIAYPYSTRPLHSERMVYRFRLQEPGVYTVYLRASSRIAQVYALSVWDVGEYMAGVQNKRLFDGLSYGVLLGMLSYNLVLLLLFRDRVYGYYVLNCGFALLSLAGFNGHVARYLFADEPLSAEMVYVVAPGLWIAGAILFAKRFLDLARFAPWVDHLLSALLTLVLGSVVAGLGGQMRWLVSVTEFGSMGGALLALVGASIGWRRGFRPAGMYILGLTVQFVAVFLLVLGNWGVLHWQAMNLNILQFGVSIELVVFSLALGSRIRIMRRAQRELNARAERLAVAAETDTLTGVCNRAGLAQAAGRLLVAGERHALLLLDLDDFKPINDQHGHEAGDEVLVSVARRLREQLRPQDVVARLGGDEFAILAVDLHERARLEQLAERLSASLAQPHFWQGRTLRVSSSLGIARYPVDGGSLKALLRAADQAMYHAKQGTRRGHAFHEDLAGRLLGQTGPG